MENFGNSERRTQSAELWGAKLRILSGSVSSDRCSATAYLYCSSGLGNIEDAVPYDCNRLKSLCRGWRPRQPLKFRQRLRE